MCNITPNRHGRREQVFMHLMSEIADVVDSYNKSDSSTLCAIADIKAFVDDAFDEAFRMVSTEWSDQSGSPLVSDVTPSTEIIRFTRDDINQYN